MVFGYEIWIGIVCRVHIDVTVLHWVTVPYLYMGYLSNAIDLPLLYRASSA